MIRLMILICLSSFFLTGCWDKIELNDISIVSGIAVEKGEKAKYKLTVSALNSTELSKIRALGNTANTTFTLEGNSISELSKKMNVGLSRQLIYTHTRILVIDKNIAEEGLMEFLDYLERSGEFRNDFNILVSDGVKASEIIKTTYPIQRDPSLKISKQLASMIEEWGGDPKVRLTDFISAMISNGRQPVCEVVTIKGDSEKGKSVDNNKKNEFDSIVVTKGMAIFQLDKLLGIVSMSDTRNYLWTQGLKKTNISVKCGKDNQGIIKYNDIQVLTSVPKLKASYKNGKVKLKVDIVGEAKLAGTQCSDLLHKRETYNRYEKELNQSIVNSIKGTISKIQKDYKVDVFGFGEYMDRKDHKTFKKLSNNWDEYFSNATVEVNSQIFLRRTGVRTDSYISDLEQRKKHLKE